jgi:hypothetical protein
MRNQYLFGNETAGFGLHKGEPVCIGSLSSARTNGIRLPLLGKKPDLNPLTDLLQGNAKLDCVRVWFTCKNKKMMVSLSLTPERAGGLYVNEDPPTTTFGCVSLEGQNMVQFSLTVCMAIGDFGHPVVVGVATNEMVMSDGATLIDEVIAPAIGVGVGVVVGHVTIEDDDDMEDIAGGAATKEETTAVGLP